MPTCILLSGDGLTACAEGAWHLTKIRAVKKRRLKEIKPSKRFGSVKIVLRCLQETDGGQSSSR
eukprot:scaffold312392_cov21-Tisochrysis_lutea.AAC.1